MKNKVVFLFVVISMLFVWSACSNSGENKQKQESKEEVTIDKEKAATTKYDLLQGRWTDTEDAKSEIEFAKNKWIFIYDGKNSSEAEFLLSSKCLTAKTEATNNDGNMITLLEGGDFVCYEILKVDAENLSLSFLSRGNTLNFKKKK